MSRPPTWPELDQEAASQRSAFDRGDARIRALGAGALFAAHPRATGRTAACLRVTQAEMDSAASLLDAWRDRLAGVTRLLDGPRHHDSLARVTELLYGDTVRLAASQVPKDYRRPPSATSTEPRFSLTDVGEFVEDSLRTVESQVREFDEILAATGRVARLLPLVDGAAQAEDGRGEGTGHALPRGEITRLLECADTDPLALLPEDVEALEVTLVGWLCARFSAAIDRLEDRESALRDDSGRNPAAQGPPPTRAAPRLRDRLRDLEKRREREHRADPAALSSLADALAAARHEDPAAGQPPCVRPGCGGVIDEYDLCDTCFRAPVRNPGEGT